MPDKQQRRPRPEPPAPEDAAADAASEAPMIWDVWSRPESKYRVRAIVLLIVDTVLFAGLGVFAFWLRSGLLFAPRMANYWAEFWRTFQPAGEDRIILSDLLTFPISIYDVPLQIVVLGLLLAALVSIPILISILYRFPACIPFLLVIAFLAMMPWLALTVAGSCLLASVKPFRFSFRYASALLGLSLVVVYFFSASRQSASAVQLLDSPADQIKFVAPWVLAIIASCVVCGFVLVIARAVNYRPGAVLPLLATMFAVPVLLFEFYVGRDELQYRLLMHRYGPGSAFFADKDVSDEYARAVDLRMRMHDEPAPPREAVEAQVDLRWQLELELLSDRRTLFAEHRDEAIRACDRFLHHYPDSRYACNALYVRGLAKDMRVDLSTFRSDKVIRFYNTFPDASSRHSWEKLYAIESQSRLTPLSAVALLRLAQLDARECNVAQAIDRLETLIRNFQDPAVATTQPIGNAGPLQSTFATRRPAASLTVPIESTLFEARRFLDLLRSNGSPPGGDPLYGFAPMCGTDASWKNTHVFGMLRLSPRDAYNYSKNLRLLLQRYPDCLLADNIQLEIAKREDDLVKRTALLEDCVNRRHPGDALPEALFRLGEAYQQAERPGDARQAFQRILTEFPDSIWKHQAELKIPKLPITSESGV